jgi:hypothetical protein
MFVDRTKSVNVGFDGTFPNIYYAPLAPGSAGVWHVHTSATTASFLFFLPVPILVLFCLFSFDLGTPGWLGRRVQVGSFK